MGFSTHWGTILGRNNVTRAIVGWNEKCIFLWKWHNGKCGETGNNASLYYEATHFVVVCSTSWWWSSSVRPLAAVVILRFRRRWRNQRELHWAYKRWRGGPICNFLRLFSSISPLFLLPSGLEKVGGLTYMRKIILLLSRKNVRLLAST